MGDRPVDLDVLVGTLGLDLDRRAAAEDVVLLVADVETDEANPEPVVLGAVQVLDPVEAGSARGDQILVAVAVEIVGAHGAEAGVAGQAGDLGELELERLGSRFGGLGQHPKLAVGDQGQVAAAVVVGVEQGQVGGASGQADRFRGQRERAERAVLAGLQHDRGSAGEHELGNAVPVEVGGADDAYRGPGRERGLGVVAEQPADEPSQQVPFGCGRRSLDKASLAEVVQPEDAGVVGQQEIRVAVAVGVGGLKMMEPPRFDLRQRLASQRLEGAFEDPLAGHVAQQIGPAAGSRHREVEIAVAVEVDQVRGVHGEGLRQEAVAGVGELGDLGGGIDLPDGERIAGGDEVEPPVVVGVADDQQPGVRFRRRAGAREASGGAPQLKLR